jgi:hypothetical protein
LFPISDFDIRVLAEQGFRSATIYVDGQPVFVKPKAGSAITLFCAGWIKNGTKPYPGKQTGY